MADGQLGTTLEYIRRIANAEALRQATDGELLVRFHRDREESAFAALVNRHGPMVFRICWNILRDRHDSEDAFQATFLVLARKANSLGKPMSLCNWIYGVAYRVALKARTGRGRRQRHEQQGMALDTFGSATTSVDDSGPALLAEIERLPACYRPPMRSATSRTRQGAKQPGSWDGLRERSPRA